MSPLGCRCVLPSRDNYLHIVEAAGVSQRLLSRILGGKIECASRLIEQVCLFVRRMDQGLMAGRLWRMTGFQGATGYLEMDHLRMPALTLVIRSTKALAYSAGQSAC